MKIIVSGQHPTEFSRMESYAQEKVQKLSKYFPKILKVQVRLIWERSHRNQLHNSTCEMTADIPGRNLEIVERDESMDKAIDRAVERMHRLLVKTKERKISVWHKRGIREKRTVRG